jgi:hypothetical protein
MRRRVFTVSAVILLGAWLAALSLWLRSYWVESRTIREYRHFDGVRLLERRDILTSRRGRIHVSLDFKETELHKHLAERALEKDPAIVGAGRTDWDLEEIRPPVKWGFSGRWGVSRHTGEKSYNSVNGPYRSHWSQTVFSWGIVLAVLGVTPLCWLAGVRRELWRRKRVRAGLCVQCGYDLRATSGRCPECGKPGPRMNTNGHE